MIPNIGAAGRRRRLTFGLVALGAAIVVGSALVVLAAPRGWRLLLFVPLWLAGLGFFQARDKT